MPELKVPGYNREGHKDMIRQSKVGSFRTKGVRGLSLFVAALGLICAVIAGTAVPAFAYDKAEADIPVEVTLSGDKAESVPGFTVTAKPQNDASYKALAEGTLFFNGAGKASFAVTASEPVEYSYKVTQTVGNAENWTYDSRIYQVTVQFWNDNSEKLTPKVFVYEIDASGKKVGKAELCSFDNSYTAPAAPEPPAKQKPEQRKEMNPDMSDTASIATIQALSALGIAFIGIAVCMRFGKCRNDK